MLSENTPLFGDTNSSLLTAQFSRLQAEQAAELKRQEGMRVALTLLSCSASNEDFYSRIDEKGILDLALDVVEASLKSALGRN